MTFDEMIDAAIEGKIQAMVVVGDNPLMFAPGRRPHRAARWRSSTLLIVIDSLLTDTAKAAHVVLADLPAYGKAGTYTNAERRVNRLQAAVGALGDARPASLALMRAGERDRRRRHVAVRARRRRDRRDRASGCRGTSRFYADFARWGKERVASEPVQAQGAAGRGGRAVRGPALASCC